MSNCFRWMGVALASLVAISAYADETNSQKEDRAEEVVVVEEQNSDDVASADLTPAAE